MKWLVTGGCGFIGRALVSDLCNDSDYRIRVLDNLSVGTREDLARIVGSGQITDGGAASSWDTSPTFWKGDILDAETVLAAVQGADVVVHLAASTGVDPSVKDPYSDCEANVFGTLNVLEGCRIAGVRRFVFASSGAPLGVQVPPLHEEMAPHPVSPYGASKLAGEGYCSAFFHSFGVETVALRFGNVYGGGSDHKDSVVAKFIKKALAGEPIEIFGDGSQTRDFIFIGDLIRAIRAAADADGVGGETFQVATARETTVGEMTDLLITVMAEEGLMPPSILHSAPRVGDVARNYSSTTKALEWLGWQAEVELKEGLRQTLRQFMNQPNE